MNKRLISTIVFTCSLPLAASAADLLAGWSNFNTSNVSYPHAADYVDGSITSATLSQAGLTLSGDARTVFTGWTDSPTIDIGDNYLEFSVTFAAAADLDAFYFTMYSQTGMSISVRSSLDGYTTSLGDFSPPGDYWIHRVDLSGLDAVSGTVSFRLYGYNESGDPYLGFVGVQGSDAGNRATYDAYLQDYVFALTGTAAPIPEPSTTAAILGGAFLATALISRRRR